MKTDSLTLQGSLKIERVDSLPSWSSSYTGRLLFNTSDNKMYVGKDSGFEEAGGGGDTFGSFNWDPYGDGEVDVIMNPNISFQISLHLMWTKLIIGEDIERNWISSDISSDGSFIIVAEENGRLYISSDNGVTWNETRPDGDSNKPWSCVKCSSTGSVLIVCYRASGGISGKIFVSSNSGSSWTEMQPAGSGFQDWISVSTNSDGSAFIAASYGGRIWYSSNSGSSWTETRPLGDTNQNWQMVSMDSTNSVRSAAIENGGLYYSGSVPTTWYALEPAGIVNGQKWKLAHSASSYMILSVTTEDDLYIMWSTNFYSWTPLSISRVDSSTEFAVGINGQGNVMMCAGNNGGLYTGRRALVILQEQYPAGNTNLNWKTISCSTDTSTMIAACNPGYIYIMRGGLYAAITPYDVVKSVRGGTPPYTYNISLGSDAYVGASSNPKVPLVKQKTAANPKVTVLVTDSLGKSGVSYLYTYVQDPDGTSY